MDLGQMERKQGLEEELAAVHDGESLLGTS